LIFKPVVTAPEFEIPTIPPVVTAGEEFINPLITLPLILTVAHAALLEIPKIVGVVLVVEIIPLPVIVFPFIFSVPTRDRLEMHVIPLVVVVLPEMVEFCMVLLFILIVAAELTGVIP
jgi:hypothetical protein